MCARSASLAQDERKDTTFFRHNATMLRRLSRRGVTASRASFRTDDIRTRAVASSSPAFLNEDDKDGGKTIRNNRIQLGTSARSFVVSRRRHLHHSTQNTDAYIVFTFAHRTANAAND
jgi:hypothetical protein